MRPPTLLPLFALWASTDSSSLIPYREETRALFSLKEANFSGPWGEGRKSGPQVVPGGNYGFSLLAVPMVKSRHSSPTQSVPFSVR